MKYSTQQLVVSTLLASLLSPSILFAQTPRQELRQVIRQDRALASSTGEQINFCTEIDTVLATIDTASTRVTEKKTQIEINRADKKQVLVGNIAAKRTEVETAKLVLLNELQIRVKTPAQQQALDAFTIKARNANITKNNAIDLLIKNEQASVAEALLARDIEIAKATSTLKTALNDAKTKAKTDCTTGVNPQTVRKTLRESVEKALQNFRTKILLIQKNQTVSKVTKDVKKEDVKKIMLTYQTTMKQAREELKAALRVDAQASPSQ